MVGVYDIGRKLDRHSLFPAISNALSDLPHRFINGSYPRCGWLSLAPGWQFDRSLWNSKYHADWDRPDDARLFGN